MRTLDTAPVSRKHFNAGLSQVREPMLSTVASKILHTVVLNPSKKTTVWS